MSELNLKDLIEFKRELTPMLVGARRALNLEHLAIMEAAEAKHQSALELLKEAEYKNKQLQAAFSDAMRFIDYSPAVRAKNDEYVMAEYKRLCAKREELING